MTKLSLSSAWEESRHVLRHDGSLLVTVALALVGIPLALVNFILPPVRPDALPPIGAWVLVMFAGLLLGLAGILAIVKLSLGSHVSVGEAVRLGFRRLPVFVAAILLLAVPLALLAAALSAASATQSAAQAQQIATGMFLLIILLLSPLVSRFVILPAVAAAESGGPIAIIKRTWVAGRNNGLRLWGTFLLLVIAWLVVEFAFNVAVGSLLLLLFGDPKPLSVSKLVFSLTFGLLRAAEAIIVGVMLARIYLQLVGRVETQPGVPSTGI